MRPSRFLRLSLLFATIASLTTLQASGAARVQIFGVTGASDTYANGINLSGTIVGSYYDSVFTSHGFLRSPAGIFTTFDVPGAYTNAGGGTFAWAINNGGEAAGVYSTGPTSSQGFLRDAAGNITTFEVPGETLSVVSNSTIGINDAGQIAGVSFGTDTADIYIRDTDGTFTIFTPGGGDAAYVGINSLGEVAGTYVDTTARVLHGFVRDASGSVTTFDIPGAIQTQPGYGTWAYTINRSGVIAGFWVDTNFIGHGYLRSPSGMIQSYDVPKGTGTTFGDAPYINDGGMVASDSFNDSNSAWTPFIRDHAGNMTTFGVSGSKEAIIDGINRNGQVCGDVPGKKGIWYGFLRTP